MSPKLLAVIPARGGSKGFPGKNVHPFMNIPLIAHSILFAKMCPQITRCIVSTDSKKIASVAKQFGADVPFLRPAALSGDHALIWPVLKHALSYVERASKDRYDALLLLDPTSPARLPEDVSKAFKSLMDEPRADGIIGVSVPDFSPIWHCVVIQNGFMADFTKQGSKFNRRQEVPTVYRINGSLYIWKASFIRKKFFSWRKKGRHLIYEIPEFRAISIDTYEQFRRAEVLVKSGLIDFPWLKKGN